MYIGRLGIDSKESNFYLRNKKLFKNKYIIALMFSIWCSFFIPSIVVSIVSPHSDEKLTLLRGMLTVSGFNGSIMLIIVRLFIPKYNDIWNMRQEIISILYAIIFCLIGWIFIGYDTYIYNNGKECKCIPLIYIIDCI